MCGSKMNASHLVNRRNYLSIIDDIVSFSICVVNDIIFHRKSKHFCERSFFLDTDNDYSWFGIEHRLHAIRKTNFIFLSCVTRFFLLLLLAFSFRFISFRFVSSSLGLIHCMCSLNSIEFTTSSVIVMK